ncbi:VOC family protein [Sphingomonas sp. CGMCC 1.13654]|uniref:VOC family protein n=1 Tax=Sphingomonas chungangi TaxID=2683589 RepID=A0A838L3R2_9SPHN|nr:VOC family protein [Sphingomonas chungangi]MBA2933560.1 VOC family protein [Sphingomonas chungangi]MVW54893.1 hypothetical protein [Sphingomonas chungangi]
MTDLHDIRYVRVGTERLDESVEFATRILGLELVARDSHAAYLRGDDRDHNVCYVKGEGSGHAVGFEMKSSSLLDRVATELQNAGIAVHHGRAEECEQRRVRDMIRFTDPSGNRIELVARPDASGTRYFPSRDAGITSFSHVGMRTTDAATDEAFWTQRLGARVSDWIGDAALLRIDGVHHKIALFPSPVPGVQHINFQVAEVDDIMSSWYFLREQGVRIAFGPGRHATSGARFLYFYGPDGMIYEYSCGVRIFTPEEDRDHVPRQFPREPRSYCMWGSKPDIAEFKAPSACEAPQPQFANVG